jgi:hypothetical protein
MAQFAEDNKEEELNHEKDESDENGQDRMPIARLNLRYLTNPFRASFACFVVKHPAFRTTSPPVTATFPLIFALKLATQITSVRLDRFVLWQFNQTLPAIAWIDQQLEHRYAQKDTAGMAMSTP